jgi:hypothetical protein
MIRSTQELREFLFVQMQGLVDGTADIDAAKGICNLAQQVYNSKLIEIKIAKAKSELGDTAIEAIRFDDA